MNPANWGIVNFLQGQSNNNGAGGGAGGGGGGVWGSSFAQPTNFSGSGFPTPSGPAVLGSSDDNSGLGYMYYDTALGRVVSSDPSTNPTPTSNPTRSQFNSSGSRVTPVDPFAQWGGKAAYDSGINQIQSGKQNVDTSATEGVNSRFNQGRGTILDFIDDAKLTQQGIDQKRQNAQFSQLQGGRDIQEMVGRGIRSGGVMLANKNAASSSAAGQIARAYGDLGNREMKDVNNQFALENQGIDVEQQGLATAFEKQKRDIDMFKQTNADSIAQQARNDLAALEQMRLGASLPEQFKINQEVQRIKDSAMSRLSELDGLLTSEYSKIQPMGQPDVRAKAYQMQEAGTSAPQMFNFNTNAQPLQVSGGVAGAELPIYSNLQLNRRREV